MAFDLETSDLKALMGRIFCCSFQPIAVPRRVYTYQIFDKLYKQRTKIDDSRLCVAIRDELETYNMVVGWNSKLFDMPLLNARLARVGERPCRPQFHLDLMWFAGGSSLRIGSRKLVNVQKFFKLGASKTEIEWEQWQAVAAGDASAMKAVVDHCEADVRVLAEVYDRLLPYVANIHR